MIIFRKSGNFYSVYDNDAIILHYLFGYKIKESRVGFPLSSIEKVVAKLDELHVNYRFQDKEMVFEDNKYDNLLIESKNKISLDYKINEIESKINSLDYNKLNGLLELIETYLNE